MEMFANGFLVARIQVKAVEDKIKATTSLDPVSA
jgi:hypothetical protein